MIVSVTEIMTFLRCRRQWDYSSFNRQGLTPVVVQSHFSLGIAVHEALADWLTEPDKDLVEIYKGYAYKILNTTIDNYTRIVGTKPSQAELAKTFEDLTLGQSMMSNYQSHWKRPISDDYKVLSPEQTVKVDIPGTSHQLEATFDGLIQNKRENVLPLEHKTYNSRPRHDMLFRNFQFKAYCWAVTQLGFTCPGLAYDGMWKRAEPPRNCKMSDLFLREIIPVKPEQLQSTENHIVAIVRQMADEPYLQPIMPWNGCWDCGFTNLCDLEEADDYSEFNFIRSTRYAKRDRTTAFVEEPND